MLSTPEQTDTRERKSADSVQAQLPSAAPAPPLLPTASAVGSGLSCSGLHSQGASMAQEEQGMSLHLVLRASRSKVTWPLALRSPPVQNVRIPLYPSGLFDRSPLCLNRLLGQVIGPQHSGLLGPAGMFPCFKSKVPPILHAHPSWIPTSHHQPPSQWL